MFSLALWTLQSVSKSVLCSIQGTSFFFFSEFCKTLQSRFQFLWFKAKAAVYILLELKRVWFRQSNYCHLQWFPNTGPGTKVGRQKIILRSQRSLYWVGFRIFFQNIHFYCHVQFCSDQILYCLIARLKLLIVPATVVTWLKQTNEKQVIVKKPLAFRMYKQKKLFQSFFKQFFHPGHFSWIVLLFSILFFLLSLWFSCIIFPFLALLNFTGLVQDFVLFLFTIFIFKTDVRVQLELLSSRFFPSPLNETSFGGEFRVNS